MPNSPSNTWGPGNFSSTLFDSVVVTGVDGAAQAPTPQPIPTLQASPAYEAPTYAEEDGDDGYEEVTIQMTPSGPMAKKKAKTPPKPGTFDTLVRDTFRFGPVTKFDPKAVNEFNALHNLSATYKFTDPQALVGIEVEVENIQMINPNLELMYWSVTNDGSLRNNGREFKTKPIPLSCVAPALTQLFLGLNRTIDFSIRTSIHVHQDVRGMSLGQLLTLIFGYIVVENLLFKFAGSNRKNSIYCVPIGETEIVTNLASMNGFISNIRHMPGSWHKYTALNVAPIATFGTVEYRHMPGTDNVSKILIWIDLLSRLKVWAYKTPLATALRTLNQLNTTSSYRYFLNEVFGDLVSVLDTSTLLPDMERNVSLVRSASITNEFHHYARRELQDESMLAKALQVKRSEYMKMRASYRAVFDKFASQFISHTKIEDAFDQFIQNIEHYRAHPLTKSDANLIFQHYQSVCAA
jgi:putative amidoligase enzyme